MEKLLAIISLLQRVYGRLLFQRLLSRVIAIVGLTIIASIMVSTLMIGCFYATYIALQYYGAGQSVAMGSTGAFIVLITGLLFILIRTCLRRLRQLPKTILKQSPVTSRLMDMLEAFSNGFMTDESQVSPPL